MSEIQFIYYSLKIAIHFYSILQDATVSCIGQYICALHSVKIIWYLSLLVQLEFFFPLIQDIPTYQLLTCGDSESIFFLG